MIKLLRNNSKWSSEVAGAVSQQVLAVFVVMLLSSTESLSSISLFVYCASPTPPTTSSTQFLVSNQCHVLNSYPGPAGLLSGSYKLISQHCTLVKDRIRKHTHTHKHTSLGQVFAPSFPPSVFLTRTCQSFVACQTRFLPKTTPLHKIQHLQTSPHFQLGTC